MNKEQFEKMIAIIENSPFLLDTLSDYDIEELLYLQTQIEKEELL